MIIYCTNGYSRLSKDGGLHGDGTFEEEMEDHHFSNKEDAVWQAKQMQFGTVARIDLGNVDKACVIAMLNQRQFAKSYDMIWEDGGYSDLILLDDKAEMARKEELA